MIPTRLRRSASGLVAALLLGGAGALPQPARAATPLRVDGGLIYETNDTLLRRFPSRYGGTAEGSANHIAHDRYADEVLRRMDTLVEPLGGYTERRPLGSESMRFANLVAVVPGADPLLKNQFVVLGGHYDCTQNHIDGAIDCGMQVALDLAILEAFARYWTSNGLRPQRSLMVLLTDGEEQCLCGSVGHSISVHQGLQHLELPPQAIAVAYHDTDMIGANYPGRYFGRSTLDFMPLNVFSAPAFRDPSPPEAALRTSPAYAVTAPHVEKFRRYRDAMLAARDRLFEDMRSSFGRTSITYSDGATRPLFSDDQKKYVNIIDDPLGRSDHQVLIAQGIPSDIDIGLVDPTTNPPGLLEYHNGESLEFLNWMYSGQQRKSPLTLLGLETAGMFVAYMLGANHAAPGDFLLGETDA